MILVIGATGHLGFAVCRELIKREQKVTAMARTGANPMTRGRLLELGVKCVDGDLRDAASLKRVCEGVEVVISSATAMMGQNSIEEVDLHGTQELIRAAAAARVKQFVFVSFHDMGVEFPLQDAKRKAEALLTKSGMAYTILQPSFFTESWVIGPLGYSNERRAIEILGAGDQKVSYVGLDDVAQVTAAAAGNPEQYNKVLEFGGPDPMSPLDVVSELYRLGVNDLNITQTPRAQLEAQYAAATDPKWRSVAGLRLAAARGRITESDSVRTLVKGAMASPRTTLAKAVTPPPDLNFMPDDLIVAFGSETSPTYLHVPGSRYRALPAPPTALEKAIKAVGDAPVVASFPKDATFADKTAYVNLRKLVAPPNRAGSPETPKPGAAKLDWQVVVRDTSGSLHLVDRPTLNSCTEFSGGVTSFTQILDKLVKERSVVAWIPTYPGATGGVCILLNVASLSNPAQ